MNRKFLSILFFIFGLVALRSGILNMYTFSNLELCLSVGLGTGTTFVSIIFYIKIIAGPRCTKCNSIEWRLAYWKNYWFYDKTKWSGYYKTEVKDKKIYNNENIEVGHTKKTITLHSTNPEVGWKITGVEYIISCDDCAFSETRKLGGVHKKERLKIDQITLTKDWQLPLFRQPDFFITNSSEGIMGHENPEWKAKGYTITNSKIKKEAK